MSDTHDNGEAPTLRDIAEQAYDDLETGALETEGSGPGDEGAAEEPLADTGRQRDNRGRWVAKSENQPGEAVEPLDPAPKPKIEAAQPPTDPAAQQARSNQAPEHWNAEDKATFAKLPQEGKNFLLRRHGEMEAEFTRKSQASAGAVQFTQSIAPVFNDPHMSRILQQERATPAQAIQTWAAWHKMGTSENQQDKFTLLVGLTQRMGLDPARIFAALQNQSPPLPPGFTQEDLKDPAIKLFADHIGKTENKIAALEGQIQQRERAEQAAREQVALESATQNINGFADAKSADGRPLRPHFNTVLPQLIEMFRANPQRDMAEAYETACWANPEVRQQLMAAHQFRQQSQQDIARARSAQRGNTRGLTSSVTRPNGTDGPSKGGIRDAIERSADEIGY
jgi:hypothetical protein